MRKLFFTLLGLFFVASSFAQEDQFRLLNRSEITTGIFHNKVYSSWSDPDSASHKPPRPIAKEYLIGLVGGLIGGIAGYGISNVFSPPCSGVLCIISTEETYGILLGATIGSAAGVYWAGNRSNFKGSFISTVAGNALGMFIALKLWQTAEKESINWLGAPAVFLSPPVGAVIGYNLTAKYKSNSSIRICFIGNHISLTYSF